MNAWPQVDAEWFPLALPANVSFAEGTSLHSTEAFVHYRSARPCGVQVGRRTAIYDPASFAIGPNGLVQIGESCIVIATFSSDRRIVVGDHAILGVGSVIADDDFSVPGATNRGDVEHDQPAVVVGDLAFLGTRSVVLGGSRIGTGAIVGAGTVIRGSVPDYAIVAGNPPRIVGSARPAREGGG